MTSTAKLGDNNEYVVKKLFIEMAAILSNFCSTVKTCRFQGCLIFLGHNYLVKLYKMATRPHYTKRPYIIQNGHKLYQMVVKYTSIFHSKGLQNIPTLGFLVLK
jgi:hypothetical protein